MDNTLLIVILVFVVLKMLNNSPCASTKESFINFPSRDFYGTPKYGNLKIDCSENPRTFKDFLRLEERNEGKFAPAVLSDDEKIYMTYRWDYANLCENNDYYSRGSYVI